MQQTSKYNSFVSRLMPTILLLPAFLYCKLVSFPGPAHLSVACFSVLQVTESWSGPGNEANCKPQKAEEVWKSGRHSTVK